MFRKILVPVDPADVALSARAVDYAGGLARAADGLVWL